MRCVNLALISAANREQSFGATKNIIIRASRSRFDIRNEPNSMFFKLHGPTLRIFDPEQSCEAKAVQAPISERFKIKKSTISESVDRVRIPTSDVLRKWFKYLYVHTTGQLKSGENCQTYGSSSNSAQC